VKRGDESYIKETLDGSLKLTRDASQGRIAQRRKLTSFGACKKGEEPRKEAEKTRREEGALENDENSD